MSEKKIENRIGALVISHGRLAMELVNAARNIVGEADNVQAVSIGWSDDVSPSESATFDWWGIVHNVMNNVFWATPEAIGKMTFSQLLCLHNAKPPGTGEMATTFEEHEEMARRIDTENARWGNR